MKDIFALPEFLLLSEKLQTRIAVWCRGV